MLIINTTTKGYKTLHHGDPPDGWLPIPPRLTARAEAYCPYCELVIEDGELVDILPLPKPEPEPKPPSIDERVAAVEENKADKSELDELSAAIVRGLSL